MVEERPTKHEVEANVTVGIHASAEASVRRGLNEVRLAVLGILVAISLGAAALAPGWWRLVAGVGTFALSCLLIRWERSRHLLMEFMHRVTGQ
jgi:hypothetical protein